MKPKTRLNAVLLVATLASIALAALLLHMNMRKAAHESAVREARLHMATATAMRRYTTEEIQPFLEPHELPFHPIMVPSHAADAVMARLEHALPGRHYREVALNPTNPAHQAKGWTADIVQELRRSGADTLDRLATEGDQDVLHHARALRVDSPGCLRCHGDPAAVPAGVAARFGREAGVGWRLGEVVGAQIVTTSITEISERLHGTYYLSLGSTAAALLGVFLVLNGTLQHFVLRPTEAKSQAMQRLALRDSLTGAANRRRFMDELSMRMAESEGQTLPLSVVMIDLDHFKRINDNFGHATGDHVLQETVRRLRRRIRKGDLVGRLGGEEFAVLLPDADASGARGQARNLLQALASRPFETVGTVTASLGVAQWDGRESAATLLARADAALYMAKQSGRARVVLAPAELRGEAVAVKHGLA